MSDPVADRLAIRDLVENWAVWRDAGDWERFRTVWHPDGRMMATWFQGPADDFIRVSQEGLELPPVELEPRGWNDGIEPVLLVDRLAQHDAPATIAPL